MNLEEYKELEPLYTQALEFAKSEPTMGISKMQRKFMIGYNRAARLCDRLCDEGVLKEDRVNGGWIRPESET